MQDLSHWILQVLRDEKFHWLEERKSEWIMILRGALRQIVDGKSVILVCDDLCKWFGQYVAYRINNTNTRPFVPIFCAEALFPQLPNLQKEEDFSLLQDLLSIAFREQYIFWYVGHYNDICSKLIMDCSGSFLWILNKEIQNSFALINDEDLDLKLLQLFKVFNKSLSATLFGELNLEV